MIAPGSRPLTVKFILPALTEATSPYWRPIKYSLFPPLGLATLAAYLSPDDQAVIVDEHVEPLAIDDSPELVVIQVYITNAYRAYKIADHYRSKGAFVCLGGLHVTSLPEEATVHADTIFLGPGEQIFPQFLQHFRAGKPERVYISTSGRTLERIPPLRRDLIRRSLDNLSLCHLSHLSLPLCPLYHNSPTNACRQPISKTVSGRVETWIISGSYRIQIFRWAKRA